MLQSSTKLQNEVSKCRVIICDESHALKNNKAKRACVILPLLRSAKRVVLLSGTPALNKPSELHSQLEAILPQFCTYKDFSSRYCDIRINRFTKHPEYCGGMHLEELNLFLNRTVMVRRLKKDVEQQLPNKRRVRTEVEPQEKDMVEIRQLMNEMEAVKEEIIKLKETGEKDEKGAEGVKQSVTAQLWRLTGLAKIRPSWDYISYILEAGKKSLVFAHHKEVLSQLQDLFFKSSFAKKEGKTCILIDGDVPLPRRDVLLKAYTSDVNSVVAFLSLTACSHGLNLQEAEVVIFTELHWTPAHLQQAEARVDRIGSKHTMIEYHYLIAPDTLDEAMFRQVEKKVQLLGTALDGQKGKLDLDHVQNRHTRQQDTLKFADTHTQPHTYTNTHTHTHTRTKC
eukprot:GHVR01108444.1.p1 GENE.GHVR01108444.1~~GHVR01108444.1.p1  ORF type:complete len:454 (+),score=119.28 GHVR01108444.1:174-1364(+)